MLCDLLARSRVAGLPASYFRPASVATFRQAWGLPPHPGDWGADYVKGAVHHGSAGTGCVGVRIMWSDMGPFVERLHSLFPGAGSDVDVLAAALGIDRFVHLVRADRVAQAISLVLAEQTGLWHRHADGTERERSHTAKPADYDAEQITQALRLLDSEAQGWSDWFAESAVTPMVVSYEALTADPTTVVGRVVAHVAAIDVTVDEPDTMQLSDHTNRAWATRFRSEQRPTPPQ